MNSFHRPELIAHRGYSARAPENTLPAIEAALKTGVEAVELDIQTAACGTPVVFHDPMLGRTTNGVGPVRRRPLGHLKALDAGSWFGSEFAGVTIPTQEEALHLLRDRVRRVYQDVKGYREMEDLDRMVTITRRCQMAGATIFMSSDWVVLNRLRRVAPDIQRAYLVEGDVSFSDALDRAVVDEGSILEVGIGMALDHPEGVKEALGLGVECVAWVVDDPEQATRARQIGVTRMVTNEVERLQAWRDSLG